MLISRALYPGVSNPSKIGRTSPDALSLSSEGIRRLSRARVPAGSGLPRKEPYPRLLSSGPSPVIQRGVESYYNRDMFTGQQLVNPYSTPLGKGVQAGEAAAGAIYPLRLGMQAAKQGPGALAPLVGARLPQHPPGYVPPKVRQIERGKARSRERHDPVEGGVHKIIDAIGSITSSPP